MYRLLFACVVLGSWAQAQVEAHFSLPKGKYVVGEPVFLEYTVRNAGAQPVKILSATPDTFCSGYSVKVNRTDVTEPHTCGGSFSAECLSSGRTLKRGESVTEHFMVNDHGQMRTPGSYHISAIRELPTSMESDLIALHSGPKVKTSAEFDVEVVEADAQHVRSILLPYFADLSSDDWQRRSTAERVVGTLSSSAVEDLVLQLNDNPRTKHVAVRALAAANTPATRKQLAEMALNNGQDKFSEQDSFAAAGALGGSGDRSYWPLLRDMAARQPPEQASGLISSAARLGGEEAVPWLRDLLRSPDVKIKGAAIFPLASTASRQAVPVLIDMIGDPEEHIPEAAQSALVQLTHHAFNTKQIVPSDRAAAHAAWIRWWSRNAESAPIYKYGEYCGNAAPLE